jgi:hypothetical protein
LAERDADSVLWRRVGGEFVVSATQVLDERVPGRDGSSRGQSFQSAHRPQPALEPTVIGFDDVVWVPLQHVPRARRPLVDHARIHRCPVGGDLTRSWTESHRASAEGPRGPGVATR